MIEFIIKIEEREGRILPAYQNRMTGRVSYNELAAYAFMVHLVMGDLVNFAQEFNKADPNTVLELAQGVIKQMESAIKERADDTDKHTADDTEPPDTGDSQEPD